MKFVVKHPQNIIDSFKLYACRVRHIDRLKHHIMILPQNYVVGVKW